MRPVYALTFNDSSNTQHPDKEPMSRVTESQRAALFAFKCLVDKGIKVTLTVKDAKNFSDITLDGNGGL